MLLVINQANILAQYQWTSSMCNITTINNYAAQPWALISHMSFRVMTSLSVIIHNNQNR